MFSETIITAATELISLCKTNNIKIATAESCTGGLVASALTSIDGSSAVFERGYNTYSNEAKQDLLSVSLETLLEFGAVSKEVAAQMAEGALNKSPVNLSVAITGIAGPGGGTKEKPIGTIFVACACDGKATLTHRYQFVGTRQEIRLETVYAAIKMMGTLIQR